MKKLVLALMLTAAMVAEDKPKEPILPEVSKLRILAAYQKYLLAQQQLQSLGAVYMDTCRRELSDNKFPEGSTCIVNVDSGVVLADVPKSKEGKK